VPVNDAKSHVIAHRSTFDHFVWIVKAERQWVPRLGAFVLDLLNIWKKLHDRKNREG
jgi:hypothetical protein